MVIAVIIWEHTGKTGYLDIESTVKFFYYTITGLITTGVIGLLATFIIVGCMKFGYYLYKL